MKKYKTLLFNDGELLKAYTDNKDAINVSFHTILELIYELYNCETQDTVILNKSYCKNSQKDIENKILGEYLCGEEIEELGEDEIFITGEGELCNKDFVDIQLHHSHPEVSKIFKYKKYNRDKDFKAIILNRKLEEYFTLIQELGLTIQSCSLGEDEENYILSFSINFNKNDKESFITHSIKYLGNKVDNRGPVLTKLGNNLLDEILEENDNQGREGERIYIKGGGEEMFIPLLYLLLIGKIEFFPENGLLGITQGDYLINIVGYRKEEGIYFNKKNGEVFKDGLKLGSINLGTNPYKLFKYLYENIGIPKFYEEIRIKGIGNKKIAGEEWQYIHGIKRQLPNKEIKDLIETSNGQYIIRK